jgi:hypothetical protein
MSKKRNHHEPYCHNCHADFLQSGSVRITLDAGEPVIGRLEPGEDNYFDIIVEATPVKRLGVISLDDLDIECTDCHANVTGKVFGEIDIDPDFDDLNGFD